MLRSNGMNYITQYFHTGQLEQSGSMENLNWRQWLGRKQCSCRIGDTYGAIEKEERNVSRLYK